jgi:hypothetical protein
MTYVFIIAAEVDGRANIESSPNRSALPTAYANVVSAPITISSAAAQPVIHDDEKADPGRNGNASTSTAAASKSSEPDAYEPFPFRHGRKLP